jgi:hypothetical protein
MTINSILSSLNRIRIILNSEADGSIKKLSSNFISAINVYLANPAGYVPAMDTYIRKIDVELDKLRFLSDEDVDVIKKLNFDELLNIDLRGIQNNTLNPQQLLDIARTTAYRITNLTNMVNSFYENLKNFSISVSQSSENTAIIEIIYKGKARIENFSEAKDEMDDWFVIMEGYARHLGVQSSEFEIIEISKNSPAKFKIKSALKNAQLIISVLTGLYILEAKIQSDIYHFEQLKNSSASSVIPQEMLETIQKHFDSSIEKGIDKMIEEKFKNKSPDQNALRKSIERQYKFINNGGEVNVYINEGENNGSKELLEAKQQLQQIKNQLAGQQLISPVSDTEENEN